MFPIQERDEVKARVLTAIRRNQEIRASIPESALDGEHWKEFRKKAQPSTLHVRRLAPEQDRVDKQEFMYPVGIKMVRRTPTIIMTYPTRDSVGEPFEVELSRIVAIEEGDGSWLQENSFRQNGPRNYRV